MAVWTQLILLIVMGLASRDAAPDGQCQQNALVLLAQNLNLAWELGQQNHVQIHQRHWVLLLCLFVINPL